MNKFKFSVSIAFALALAASALLAGCKKAATSDDPSASCGPDHYMEGYLTSWSYMNCGPFDNMYLLRSTLNADGIPLGDRDVGKGMLSVKFKGLNNTNFGYGETFGIYFQAAGKRNLEVNWQWLSYRINNTDINSRLVMQRFDGMCPGRTKCEIYVQDSQLQFLNESDVYQWDCYWDDQHDGETPLGLGVIYCKVTKPSDPGFMIDASLETQGKYYSLTYLGVGNQAYEGPYKGYPGKAFDFKVTFFK